MQKKSTLAEVIPTLPIVSLLICLSLPMGLLAASNRPPASGWAAKADRKLNPPTEPVAQDVLVSVAGRLQQLLSTPGRAKPGGTARAHSLPNWDLAWHERNGTPVFLSTQTPSFRAAKPAASLAPARSQALALDFLDTHRRLFRLESPRTELEPVETTTDYTGRFHITFQQHYQGLPLWGCDLVVHLLPDGNPYAVNARYAPTPSSPPDLGPALRADQAVRRALDHLGARVPIRALPPTLRALLAYKGPTATQYLWLDPTTQQPHLVWQVAIRPNGRDRWLYFVDAHTGRILEAYNTKGPTTATALDLNDRPQTLNVHQAEETFYLLDAARPSFAALGSELIDRPLALLLDDPLGTILTLPGFATLGIVVK